MAKVIEWKEGLLRSARLHRMCQQNVDALRQCQTKRDAIFLYKKTIDWALEEDYPSLPVLRREFNGCQDDGIYVDVTFHGEILNRQQVYVFHHCSGHIYVDLNVRQQLIPMFYCANDCNLTFERVNGSRFGTIHIPVYSFGDNRIDTVSDGDTDFRLYEFEVKK